MNAPAQPVRVGIDEQIACVLRELSFREKVYPKWVAAGKVTKAAAEAQMIAMRSVLGTLKEVKREREAANGA
jgi:hypothetical protein